MLNKIKLVGGIVASIATVASTVVGFFADLDGAGEWFGFNDKAKKDSIQVISKKDTLPNRLETLPAAPSPTFTAKAEKKVSKVEMYLNNPSVNKTEIKEVGVAVIAEDKFEPLIGNQFTDMLRDRGFQANNFLFKQKGINDGFLGQLYNANEASIKLVELPKYVDYVLIGFLTFDFSSGEYNGMQTYKCKAKFNANFIVTKEASVVQNITFEESELSFNDMDEAKDKTKKKVLKKLKEEVNFLRN